MSTRLVRRILRRLVKVAGMTAWGRAQVKVIDGDEAVGQGWGRGVSGFQMMKESHVSVHTLADEGVIFIDFFSCREWDTNLGKELQRIIKPARAWMQTVDRHLEPQPGL